MGISCDDHDIEQRLRDQKSEFTPVQLSIARPTDAIIGTHKAAAIPTEYQVLPVKISTAAPVQCLSTDSKELQPKYIGPFPVLNVHGKVLHLQRLFLGA